MKNYRRIEITAFRRRITVVSGTALTDSAEIRLKDADSSEIIETESAEGRQVLIEAVRILDKKRMERVFDGDS